MAQHRIMPAPPPSWPSWEDVMRAALAEAEKARAMNEVPVGAVILAPDGRIVGRGHNAPVSLLDPTAHAEIAAIREAAHTLGNYRLLRCILAVTLEPCLMCVGAIVHARLHGVVFGAFDQKAGAVLSRMEGFAPGLHNHAPWQAGGILEDACAAPLQGFFSARRGS